MKNREMQEFMRKVIEQFIETTIDWSIQASHDCEMAELEAKEKEMDAGQKRIATVQRAKEAMDDGKCSCWTEVLAYIREDINALSKMTGIDPVEIGFNIIDDVEADLDDSHLSST